MDRRYGQRSLIHSSSFRMSKYIMKFAFEMFNVYVLHISFFTAPDSRHLANFIRLTRFYGILLKITASEH